MGTFPVMSALVSALTNYGHTIGFFKQGRVSGAAAQAPVAARMSSLWQYEGCPSHGAVPTTVETCTSSLAGSLVRVAASGGRTYKLTGFSVQTNVIGVVYLMDRLVHIGGLSGTSTSPQAVGGTITRNTAGKGNMAFLEVYSQIGATPTTATLEYTDDDGNDNQVGPAFAVGGTGLREAQRLIPIPLASGDSGVRAVESVTLAGSTGTVGDFGITIARPICPVGIVASGFAASADLITALPALLDLDDDPCLFLAFMANTTTVPDNILGIVQLAEA